MKPKFLIFIAMSIAIVSLSFCVNGAETSGKQVTVSSLEELLPYLAKDSVDLVMTPGTYRVKAKDVEGGKFYTASEITEGQVIYSPFLIKGNNNNFDFTGVTIEIETGVFNAYKGKYADFYGLHFIGNDNVVKNLTMVDVGKLTDFPKYGACNVVIDGARNTLDGVEVRSQGSMPFGYGEIFGKGRIKTLPLKKHSSCLVRGDFNTMRNCRVIHHAFGHFIFMQAAQNPTIEGCYVEGMMSSTDRILLEEGSGSSADKIDFKTIWGYRAPKGYTLALGEDGIRTYNRGTTMIDGKTLNRGTQNVTVRDCVVKHARGGVALTLSSGKKIIENCTLIGCQGGFNVGSGAKIINCRADAAFGPVFSVAYDKDRDITVDITVMPYDGEKFAGNGSRQVAYIIGSGHNITLRKGEGLQPDEELEISIGGDERSVGQLADDNNEPATNIRIDNQTDFKIVVDDNATSTKIRTSAKVIDNGAQSVIERY